MALYELIDNPYGIMHTGGVIRIKGGDRTHVEDKKKGGALCGAGRDYKGREIRGAVIRGTGGPRKLADKVAKNEVDCLRCIKILYVDHNSKALIGRSFRASSVKKRDGHNMIIGGRSGEFIGRKPARGARADKAAMEKLGYSADEISAYGPAKVSDFRRGSDRHPTQTRYAAKRTAAKPVAAPAARPAARREFSQKQLDAQQAMRLYRAGRAASLAEAHEMVAAMNAGEFQTMLVANPRRKASKAKAKASGARRDAHGRFVKSKKR